MEVLSCVLVLCVMLGFWLFWDCSPFCVPFFLIGFGGLSFYCFAIGAIAMMIMFIVVFVLTALFFYALGYKDDD